MAVATGQVIGPCSDVEFSVLGLYLPAVGRAIGLDGVEDGDALDGQRAGISHPSESDGVTCGGLDVEDLKRNGRLTTLADVELFEV